MPLASDIWTIIALISSSTTTDDGFVLLFPIHCGHVKDTSRHRSGCLRISPSSHSTTVYTKLRQTTASNKINPVSQWGCSGLPGILGRFRSQRPTNSRVHNDCAERSCILERTTPPPPHEHKSLSFCENTLCALRTTKQHYVRMIEGHGQQRAQVIPVTGQYFTAVAAVVTECSQQQSTLLCEAPSPLLLDCCLTTKTTSSSSSFSSTSSSCSNTKSPLLLCSILTMAHT